jgi:hypothetical protein
MALMTPEVMQKMTEEQIALISNSIDQTVIFGGKGIFNNLYRPMGDKPVLHRCASGLWLIRNTCRYWGDRFEFECAIDWCDRENRKLGFPFSVSI